MIDGHVHIERGPYSLEWIDQFVHYATRNGVRELYLLEHSHRFKEFSVLYEGVRTYNDYQSIWLSNKLSLDLSQYIDLVKMCRNHDFDVNIKWGLEMCYFEGFEESVYKKMRDLNFFEFITGSIHFIDDWGFDHKREFWEGKDVDELYMKYYTTTIDCVRSGLFDHLGHPDSIKCFGLHPKIDCKELYEKLAKELVKNKVKAEYSSGLKNNYGYFEVGLSDQLLEVFYRNGVQLITASDAHSPEDVGRNVEKNFLRKRGN